MRLHEHDYTSVATLCLFQSVLYHIMDNLHSHLLMQVSINRLVYSTVEVALLRSYKEAGISYLIPLLAVSISPYHVAHEFTHVIVQCVFFYIPPRADAEAACESNYTITAMVEDGWMDGCCTTEPASRDIVISLSSPGILTM